MRDQHISTLFLLVVKFIGRFINHLKMLERHIGCKSKGKLQFGKKYYKKGEEVFKPQVLWFEKNEFLFQLVF